MKAALLIFILSIYMVTNFSDTQEQPQIKKKRNPGPAGCGYYGSLSSPCSMTAVPCDVLSEHCSFFLYDGLVVDRVYHVKHYYSKADEVHFDELLKCSCKKPVYVFYSHLVEQLFSQVHGCNGCNGQNAEDEMVGLQAYMTEHPGVAGFVLCDLEFNTLTDDPFPDFTENLSTYINVMKSTFPDKVVALHIKGKFLIDQYTEPQTRQWLELKIISELLDFVVISFARFNDCNEEFKCGGTIPLNGNANYTMEKVKRVLDEQGVPKEKRYLMYPAIPYSPAKHTIICDLSYLQVCVNKSGTADWCTENSHSLVEKGNFAQKYAAGFIYSGIDLDYNTKDSCNCKVEYPTFKFILDGFNNSPADSCPLFNIR